MEEEELEEESYGEEEGEQVTAATDEAIEADAGCGLIPHVVTLQELATKEVAIPERAQEDDKKEAEDSGSSYSSEVEEETEEVKKAKEKKAEEVKKAKEELEANDEIDKEIRQREKRLREDLEECKDQFEERMAVARKRWYSEKDSLLEAYQADVEALNKRKPQ